MEENEFNFINHITNVQLDINGKQFTDCMESTLLFFANNIVSPSKELQEILNKIKDNDLIVQRTEWAKFLYLIPEFEYKRTDVEILANPNNIRIFFEKVLNIRIKTFEELDKVYGFWQFSHKVFVKTFLNECKIYDVIYINENDKIIYKIVNYQIYGGNGKRKRGHVSVMKNIE